MKLWEDALRRFDTDFLGRILADGWTLSPSACDLVDVTEPAEGILQIFFSSHSGGTAEDKLQSIVSGSSPLPQIHDKLLGGLLRKDITTYEAIHLYCHGFALIAEALVNRYGKQGEFIVYDMRLEEISRTEFEKLTVEQFVIRRRNRFNGGADEYDMHSAGLDVEFVSSTDREITTRTRECEWVRYYKERHPHVGYLMCCSVDQAAYRAVNDDLRLCRKATLMEGDQYCDFRIFAASDEPSNDR